MKKPEVILLLIYALMVYLRSVDAIGSYSLSLIFSIGLIIYYLPFGFKTLLKPEERTKEGKTAVIACAVPITLSLLSIFFEARVWFDASAISLIAIIINSVAFIGLLYFSFKSELVRKKAPMFLLRMFVFGMFSALMYTTSFCKKMNVMYGHDVFMKESINLYCSDKTELNKVLLKQTYDNYWIRKGQE